MSALSSEARDDLVSAALGPEGGERWLPVALLGRPQGRRGEILSEPLTDQLEIFRAGAPFRLASEGAPPGTAPAVTLEACWRPHGRNAGRLVLKLAGIDSIDAAQAVKGQQLSAPATAFPALAAHTYFVRDLLGCQLFADGRLLGTVTDLQFPVGPDGHTRLADAVDLLVLTPCEASPLTDPVLIPFVRSWLVAVETAEKRITMRLPTGLPGLSDESASLPL